ncbi:MAG TPA: hypothetical protein PLI09_11545 [Candidatus Hydrogenedentes bacterium]|nr:hypothetical protein [Candidatus Hydrogenedentota bacterium]
MENAYEWEGLLLFCVLSMLPAVPFIIYATRYVRTQQQTTFKKLLLSMLLMGVVYIPVVVDAFWIEPNWPVLDRIDIEGNVTQPLRILQLSDLHLEMEPAKREEWLLRQLDALSPDLIVLTGDIHQLDMTNPAPLKRILSRLHAPLGILACVGFDNTRVITAANPEIRFLENASIILHNGSDTIGVIGLLLVGGKEEAYAAMKEATYRITLNHTPDLADETVEKGMDLYLCGHAHGGQVRIPFWGAIITNCESGKKYESGLYQRGSTYIYTSRGFGLEPRPAPQVRFLCRPQVTLITVHPKKNERQ